MFTAFFLITLLPVLYHQALIRQTMNFICIHSSLFFLRSTRKKSSFNQKCLLEGNMKNTRKAGKLTFYCAAKSPFARLAMSAHRTSIHKSSTGSFSTHQETWPMNVWIHGEWLCCPKWGQLLRLAMWYCEVPRGHCCQSACFTLKLPTVPHQHLEALSTGKY